MYSAEPFSHDAYSFVPLSGIGEWTQRSLPVRVSKPRIRPGVADLLRERRSIRDYDDARPITLAELGRFLDCAARVRSKWTDPLDFGDGDIGPDIDYTSH